ncbi:MAG: hypothetical protein NUW23_08565, partial [Firmicutes bacterium]|nr:hypothetical protein [Bacillota bacterium]
MIPRRRRKLAVKLRFASRDDARAAKALFDHGEVGAVHPLASAGALDGFFVFMKDIGFIDKLSAFNIFGYKRMMLPLSYFLLSYAAKIILGIPSMNALPELLFANRATAESVGVEGLLSYDQYGPASELNHIRRKDFTPKP